MGEDPIPDRDTILIVDSHGVELKEWTPADAPSSSHPFYVGDYAPDVMGNKVVFTTLRHACDGSKGYEIATANLDGSGYRRLTDADGSDILPAWSPDGSRIAFLSNRIVDTRETNRFERQFFNVYVMDADGWNVRSLAPDIFLESGRILDGYHYAVSPPESLVWSPNGWLAFRDRHSLYTVHPEKSGVVSLGQSTEDPAWSPDGEWIAWLHSDSTGSIFVSRADGTEERRVFRMDSLAGYVGYDQAALSLSWTPDGQSLRLVFVTLVEQRTYTRGLYQVSLGGGNPQLIAEVPAGVMIFWSPDGSRALVFNRLFARYENYSDGEELLYTIAADWSDKRVLLRYTYDGPVAANGE